MQYSVDEFLRLMELVEAQGGEHVDEIHEKRHEATHNNCEKNAQFDVPYEPAFADMPIMFVRVCAEDDRMGLWPRFAAAKAPGYGS